MIPTSGASTSISSNAASTSGMRLDVGLGVGGGSPLSGSLVSIVVPLFAQPAATRSTARAAMSRAHLHSIEADQLGGIVGAARGRRPASGPSPVTFSTRPPAVTISPSLRGGAGVGDLDALDGRRLARAR